MYRLKAVGWKRPREFQRVLADRIGLRGMVKWGCRKGGDTVSTEAVASRRHAGGQPPTTGRKLELPITIWHLLLN